MSDQPPARFEQPLLEAREGPGTDGDGQNQPAEQIAEVVGDDPQQQADLIGPESVTGEPGPVSGFLALLDPLLRGPALVVEADDRPVGPGERRDDEVHPRKEFPKVMLDLGDYAPQSVRGGRLILAAPIAN